MSLVSAGPLVGESASDRVRERLIKAGGEVFAERGYEGATVREICARAAANVAALNYYFGNKLGLYTEVLLSSAPDAASVLAAFEGAAPKEQILRRVIRAMAEKLCGEKKLDIHFRLMTHEMAQPTPAVERVIDEALRPVYDRLRKLIGEIAGLSADHELTRLCTHSVVGQLLHYAHGRQSIGRLWPEMKMTPKQLDRISEHIADVLLAYLQSRASTSALRPARLQVMKRRKGS